MPTKYMVKIVIFRGAVTRWFVQHERDLAKFDFVEGWKYTVRKVNGMYEIKWCEMQTATEGQDRLADDCKLTITGDRATWSRMLNDSEYAISL